MPELTRQAFRFELAPTPCQADFLNACAGASRFWFNQGLATVKARLDARAVGQAVSVPWSYKALCSELDKDRRAQLAPWQAEVVCGSYQAGFEALGKALQNFTTGRRSGRHVGFPRYRRKGACRESVIFQRPRITDARHVHLDRRLGALRTKESLRKLTRLLARDSHARVLRSTVSRSGRGWTIAFTVERCAAEKRVSRSPRRPGTAVGVDVGLTHLATLSTGETVANARPLGNALRTLRRLQRQVDRQRRANNPLNYDAAGRIVARSLRREWQVSTRQRATEERIRRLHGRVANLRREQAHLLTTGLVREYGVIGVETLAVHNLMANRRLARHIADVGWGLILTQLSYKAGWAGSTLVAADRFFPSSKMCSGCATVKVKLSLAQRVFTCGACGLVLDRDLNAAVNLARMAQDHAQTEGLQSHVAAAGAETRNARRGHVSLAHASKRRPLKREDPSRSSQRRKTPAAAIGQSRRSATGATMSAAIPKRQEMQRGPRTEARA